MTTTPRGPSPAADPPPAVTLGELLTVLSELTDDEDEIAATLLYMVSRRRVRLILERGFDATIDRP